MRSFRPHLGLVLCLLREALDESLAHLLSRLDLAIASAQTDDIFTDEI
jgi:hypothetical protein